MSSSSPSTRPPGRGVPGHAVSGRAAAALAAAIALTAALGGCAAGDDADSGSADTAATDSSDTAGYTRYVALGDSFAALGSTSTPTSGPPACLRSTRNYPALVAERAGIEEFVDVSCGGAATPHLTAPQIPQTPPQLDALTAATDLVTLSIGGNDIGFGDIAGCVLAGRGGGSASTCRERLGEATESALSDLPGRLDEVYAGIRARSPDARIVTTAYLPLVPAGGGCAFVDAMNPLDVTWTREVTDSVNRAVADAASRAGAVTVMPAHAHERHACAPAATRYTDFTGLETGSHPMHPTAAGHAAMADAVLGAI